MILCKKHTSLRDSDMLNICCHGRKEECWHLSTPCRLPPQQLASLSRGQGVLCQTKLWENPTAASNVCLLKIRDNFLKKWTTEFCNSILKNAILKNKWTNKGRTNKMNAFDWKTGNILQLLGRVFSPVQSKWKISGITASCQSHIIPCCSHHFMYKTVSRIISTTELDAALRKPRSLVCMTVCRQFFCWPSFSLQQCLVSYYASTAREESKSKLISFKENFFSWGSKKMHA